MFAGLYLVSRLVPALPNPALPRTPPRRACAPPPPPATCPSSRHRREHVRRRAESEHEKDGERARSSERREHPGECGGDDEVRGPVGGGGDLARGAPRARRKISAATTHGTGDIPA